MCDFIWSLWWIEIIFIVGLALQVLGCFGVVFVLVTNIVAVKTVIKSEIESFLNFLISLDCFVSICMVPYILQTVDVLHHDPSSKMCVLNVSTSHFLAMLNGLIPVGIVTYRVIYVCKPSWVMSAKQQRWLNYILLGQTLGVSVILALATIEYKDHSKHYLMCIGELPANTDRPRWDLPLSHPFRIASILAFSSRIFLVPAGYYLIFWFRDKNTSEVSGISEASRAKRRVRNAVNAKFNLLIWLSEMSSFIVLVFRGKISTVIFLLLSFGFSPMLYLVGMEETRKKLQNLCESLF